MMGEALALAYEQALRFLEPRFLSTVELTRKLRQKGYEASIIEQVCCKLRELDYLNDERLAEQVLAFYMREAKYGRLYIRQKMKLRGLVAGEALNSYDEQEVARQQLRKKFSLPLRDEKSYRKALSFLKNRGFAVSTIQGLQSFMRESMDVV